MRLNFWKIRPIEPGLVGEVVMDGLLGDGLRPAWIGFTTEMNHEPQGLMPVELLRPTDDEFLRVVIEILFMEGRRIHRIEQLVEVAQLDLDTMARRVVLSSPRL